MQKRSTFIISINKLVAIGCGLEKGQTLYSYLAEDEDKRPIMITYLDGKKRKEMLECSVVFHIFHTVTCMFLNPQKCTL